MLLSILLRKKKTSHDLFIFFPQSLTSYFEGKFFAASITVFFTYTPSISFISCTLLASVLLTTLAIASSKSRNAL